MQKLYAKFLLGILLIMATITGQAQISVTATQATTGPTSYTTLKAAFDAINVGTHKGVVTVAINGNTTETASAELKKNAAPASYTAININASGAFTVTGSISNSLINLNGASNVTLDGINSLQLVNTNISGSVIAFNGDATANTIKNTIIKGSTNVLNAGSIVSGIINFGTGVTDGNDNNIIDNCDIDGTGNASCAIFSSNIPATQPTNSTIFNSGNIIRNSKIHDNINSTMAASIAIFLSDGNTGWTIQNNSIYHSNALTGMPQYVVRSILIVPDFTGDAHTVTGNFVGGNAPNATGTMSFTAAPNAALGYIGIDVETAGTGNLVENNTVRNITLSYGFAGGSFANAAIFGFVGGFDGTTTINGNTVSNLNFTNTAGFISLAGIHVNGRVVGAPLPTLVEPEFTITNNNISNITLNSGGAAGDIGFYGIRLETSSSGGLGATNTAHPLFTVTGNTISNISSPFTGSTNGSIIRAIGTVVSQGTTPAPSTAQLFPVVDISNNTIHTISAATNFASYVSGAVAGVHFGGSGGANNPTDIQRISLNTIYNLSVTNSGDFGNTVVGISANTGRLEITRNRIYDLRNASSGATSNPGILGIQIRNTAGESSVANNFVSLGLSTTNNVQIFGVINNVDGTGPVNVTHNTIHIAGTGVAGNNKITAAVMRGTETQANTVTTPMAVRNNILYNIRTGGGSHYAIGNTFTTAPHGWTSNYNNLNTTNAATVALWGAASNDLAAYKANAADANSKTVATNFVNVAIGDLHLAGASLTDVNLQAVPVTGITTDYDNETRSTTAPVMGADEPLACSPASITTQPTAQVSCVGGTATFTVVAGGTNISSYQWRKNGTNIPNANSATFTLTNIVAGDFANYDVVVTNSCGTATSNAVALTQSAATAITTQPAAQTVCAGAAASFTVAATGSNLTYQWRRNGVAIAGATSATYNIAAAAAANAGNYDVVVSGGCGVVTSTAVSLTVNAGTAITTQPTAQAACLSANATFSVVATGGGLTYQWMKNGTDIAGATGSTYTITGVTATSPGNYSVRVTGTCGTVTSNAVALTLTTCTSVPQIDEDIASAVLMPNVVRNSTVLRSVARKAMKVEWLITDMQGRVVMQLNQQLVAGQNDITLQLSRLAAGTYYVVGVTQNGKTSVLPLYRK